MPMISSDEVFEGYQRDLAFFLLPNMSPGDFQHFCVTVRTCEFPRYAFRCYVVAVKVSPGKLKGMDASANPLAVAYPASEVNYSIIHCRDVKLQFQADSIEMPWTIQSQMVAS